MGAYMTPRTFISVRWRALKMGVRAFLLSKRKLWTAYRWNALYFIILSSLHFIQIPKIFEDEFERILQTT